jgi:hypothetical protein
MPRKHDYISMGYRIDAAPAGMSKADVFRAMIEAVRNGTGELPKGLEVTWRWRNTPTQAMRSGGFQRVIRDSGGQGSGQPHAGFLTLMELRLTRDAVKFAPGFEAPPPPREATAKELRAIERAEELAEEKRAAKGHRKGEGTRRRELRKQRSQAALKGWETRRKRAAERAATLAKQKRAEAARKGWETRRAAARERAAALAKEKRSKAAKKGWRKRRRAK